MTQESSISNFGAWSKCPKITVYHGTNNTILDGLASGTFFSDKSSIAKKYGEIIYSITYYKEFFYRDIFQEHYISKGFIPLKELNKGE